MGSKWKRVTVADVCISIVDCVNKTAPVVEYPTNYKMIRTPNIRSGKVTLDGCRYVEKEVYETWTRRSKPQKEDVLLTREAPLGEVGIITTDDNIFLGQRIMQYRADKNKIDPYFLLYSFLSPDLQQQFSMHEGSGSVVSHIRVGDCSKFEINIPPLEIQRSIVEILKSLDDHIDVNIKINQILEQMSQTLFKSWFVDFDPVIDNALDAGNPIPEALQSRAELRQKVRNSADFKPLPADIRALFPAEFEETELGWVPKGWITTSFNDLIELIGGGTPKTSVEEYWNGDIPWFSVVDAPNESDVYVLTTEKNITTEGLNNSSAKLLRKGTTIISARGTVGKCAMVAVPMAMNQSCYGVIGKNNISDEYVYFQLKNAVQTLQQMGHGSVFNTITRDTFKNIKVPFCNEELTNSYSLLVKNYFSKILNNNYQNIALTNLRDTLLPKLISGELSLEDLPNLANQTEPA
ncbi:restriction endonuclease subunit S [Klebsiella michiganensis]|uniref:restriction endonuclease subunit S n=1 Tax=Klebsiella michiganensis TaxID=1134687 RepID=UPI0039709760